MNISNSTKLIEIIKSILLVVLLLFTILLLYFFWGRDVFQNFIKEDLPRHEAMNAAELLQPGRIEIGFGGGDFTVTDGKFQTIMDCFKGFSDSRNLSVEEITKERYKEVMQAGFIKAVFDYYAPFSAVCEANGIDRIPGSDAIDAVGELGYASDFDDRLFVFDSKGDKYYRIIGSSTNGFEALKNEISEMEKDYIAYYPLAMIAGGAENNTLCPLSFECDIHDLACYPEDFSSKPEGTGDLIKGFFSDNFDFVRRIEQESGTLIYMYGYGRIVVTAHDSGALEYRREDDERTRTIPQLRYLDALERASSFIAAHGAFEVKSGDIFTPYIKEVIIDPDGKKGYRFTFGIRINGARIYYESGAPMVVDVTGGRVSYFRRNLINVGENDQDERKSREVYPAINVLADNIEHMGETSFEELVEKVTGFDCGYVKTNRNRNTLAAAWVISIDGRKFYFGLDDGKPIGGRR